MATLTEIKNAIESGMKDFPITLQYGGCGRAYVAICGDRKTKTAVRKAAVAAGRRYLGSGNGNLSHTIYIGYDNADSIAWSKAEQVAKNLKALGIDAFADGASD